MNKKILLLSVPFSARSLSGTKMENQGLCYLKGYLEYYGFNVTMIDGNVIDGPWFQAVNSLDFNDYYLIGFSVYSTNYFDTVKLIKAIRASGYSGHITIGGHYPTFSWDVILNKNPEIDSIITGEGERSLLELAKALEKSCDWHTIPGIASKKNNETFINKSYPLISPLTFPFIPDRSSYGDILKKQNFATISSSRGCWGNCTFCSVKSFYKFGEGPCWRPRSPVEVVNEMEYLNREHGISNFAFCDDNFIGTGKQGIMRAREIGEEILKRDLDIAYAIDCRPDDVDEELFSFLNKTGMVKVNIGIESFVERQQKLYSKTLSPENIDNALNILKKLDVFIAIYTILFDPFVSYEELLINFERAMDTGPECFPEFSTFLQLFPGIPLYEELKKLNLLNTRKILKTSMNEYWISYNFEKPEMDFFFAKCLEFEVSIDYLLSQIPRSSSFNDKNYYELYSSLRKLTCQCFINCIREIKSLSVEYLKSFMLAHFDEWMKRAKHMTEQSFKA